MNTLLLNLKEKNKASHLNSKYAYKHKKVKFFLKIKKNNNSQTLFNISHIIILLLTFLLPRKIFSQINPNSFIELKFSEAGRNQIISGQYTGRHPLEYNFNNGEPNHSLNGENFVIIPEGKTIKLFWSSTSTLSDFSNMFSGLTNIIEVKISHMFENKNNTLSFMFKDCFNLEKFTSIINNAQFPLVKDTRGMFFNCISLTSFDFTSLYFRNYDFIYYYKVCGKHSCHYEPASATFSNNIFMTYMFYNCQKLETIYTGLVNYQYIRDMSQMFFNCISLKSIDISKFFSRNDEYYVDLSYLFYNCTNLVTITGNFYHYHVSNTREMFFNFSSLTRIDLSNIITNNYIDLSYMCYNCKSLQTVIGTFNNFRVSDSKEMFYNCISLVELTFFPNLIHEKINMTKMLYNCNSIKKITIKYHDYFGPNDISFMFYNCYSLESLTINHISTVYTQFMSYMFYNCKNLDDLTFSSTSFSRFI